MSPIKYVSKLLDYALVAFHISRLPPEKRSIALKEFDEDYYLRTNPDVLTSGISPQLHFVRFGLLEGREPSPPERVTPTLQEQHLTTLREAFDPEYYLGRYPDIVGSKMAPLEHFARFGAREGRNPTSWFNTRAYRERNPDAMNFHENPLLHYLLIGQKKGRFPGIFSPKNPAVSTIAQALTLTPENMVEQHQKMIDGVIERVRTGELGRQIDKAVEIDPLVANARSSLFECGLFPLRTVSKIRQLSAILRMQAAAEHHPARAVILMPWNQMGGATKLTGHLTNALVNTLGVDNVLVITTEAPSWDFPQHFPSGTRRVDFSKPSKTLSHHDKIDVIFNFLRSMDLKLLINVNSPIFWPLIDKYGQQLKHHCKLVSYFFCNEKSASGIWVGYPNRNYHHHQHTLDSILVDSHALKEELTERFLLPTRLRDQISVLDTPISDALPLVKSPPLGDYPVVFWAGRFDRQKRVDIVYQIATRMPHIEFRLWGEMKMDRSLELLTKPMNVHLMGNYDHLTETSLEEADLWLYTSEWDGVPNMLLEIATTGIPLVGSLSGGCGEVLDLGYSYPVASVEDVDGFISAIEAVLEDPAKARVKAQSLRNHILRGRRPSLYQEAIVSALGLEVKDG